MNTAVARIDIAKLGRAPTKIDEEVIVGKDILELLAGAMYVDPLTVYREYVQNAADSIEAARQANATFPEGPLVEISLDHGQRTVRIRDFGEAVPAAQFVRRLTSIGGSRKRGKEQRGFRGVGRLSGLGYCQELIFRSRTEGQPKVLEMRWNGHVLRDRLRDASFQGSLQDLIKEVATTEHIPALGFPERFFEVEMHKVQRIRNDVLMNEEAIRSFLSQVAPVPFHPDFHLGMEIRKWLTERGVPLPISIELNDQRGPVFHRARSSYPVTPKVDDSFRGVEFFEHVNSDGELLAFAWVLDHAYAGAIPSKLGLGGIRLRAGDIQVGDGHTLAHLYPEARFASWTVGDLHVAHRRILPNGRRDEFEPTPHYVQLQDEIRRLARELTQRIRDRSNQRNRLRKVNLQVEYANAWLDHCQRDLKASMLLRTLMYERAKSFGDQALGEFAKLPATHPDRDIAMELTERLKFRFEQVHASLEHPKPGRPPKEEVLAKAAVNAILQSSFKPAVVVPLAQRVLEAVMS